MRFAQTTVCLYRLGRQRGQERRSAGRRTSTSAVLRHVPSSAGTLCARREVDFTRRGRAENDFGQRGEDSHLRSRVAASRTVGGCDDLQSQYHYRQRHVRKAPSVRDWRRIRHSQRQDCARAWTAYRRAAGRDYVRTGAQII